jgi:hypothetical protein
MYRLVAVVLILLGVYLVARVLFPIRERLEPTDVIKDYWTPEGTIGDISKDEQDRVWKFLPAEVKRGLVQYHMDDIKRVCDKQLTNFGTSQPLPAYCPEQSRPADALSFSKYLAVEIIATFYQDVYRTAQTPITEQTIRNWVGVRGHPQVPQALRDAMYPIVKAYFIDQAPPPTPQSGAVSNPSPSPENTASAPTLAAGVSAVKPTPAPESTRSDPAPIDVTGPATITINVN